MEVGFRNKKKLSEEIFEFLFPELFKTRINPRGAGCLGEGGLGKFCCTGGAEPLRGAQKSRGAAIPLDSMRVL